LDSKDGSFQLGFVSPSNNNSKDRSLRIWHKKLPIRTVVRVANQLNPIDYSSGLVSMNSTAGEAVLLSQKNTAVRSTNSLEQARNLMLKTSVLGRRLGAWKVSEQVSGRTNYCDNYYGLCGPNAMCIISDYQVCSCLKGFKPKSAEAWKLMEFKQGCVRDKPLNCSNTSDGFIKYGGLKLPDTKNSWTNQTMSLKECSAKCLSNCSCMAYSGLAGDSGCAIWSVDLLNIQQVFNGGQDLYVRMPASETGMHRTSCVLLFLLD
ncbi:lectin domain containing protein, partial [Trema orientale]